MSTDLYIRIDRKLDPARLPSLLDVFQQLLPLLCICAHISHGQWAETVLLGISFTATGTTLTVVGHEHGKHRILSII